jgi:NAD(P)-dependent dehydrogenase (short-subunit alcohol dehydrogenase family)
MEEVMAQLMAMGRSPLSMKNSTTVDYVPTLHHDTYNFIRPEQFDLKNRAVFITGASRGLGRAIAISYAKAGASKIGIGARSNLDNVVKDIREAANTATRAAPEVLAVNLDVTKAENVAKAAAEVEKAFGRCDILINNAGHLEQPLSMIDVDPTAWWRTFEVNILGMFLVSRAFIPLMLKEADSLKTVVNLSSMWGLTFFPGGSAYQISKFAILRFTEFCNAEYDDQGLLAFSFHPGSVDTELAQELPPEITQFLTDSPELGSDTLLWLTAERREWLAGRFVNAAWDMDEVLEKKDRIVKEDHLKMRLTVGME